MMMRLYISLLVITILTACSEKEVTIPDFEPPQSDRVILLEEFTGTSCSNCPQGADVVADLLSLYPNNLVVVGLHSNFLGAPAKPDALDLRTKEANDIESFLGSWISKPEAAFNRKKFDGENNIRVSGLPDRWNNFMQQELQTFARVGLDIEANYNDETRTVDFRVIATARENMTGDFRINVMITESEIIAPQKSTTTTIEKYKHKFALRSAITDIEGNTWFNSLNDGLQRERDFSFTLPDEEEMGWWVPENCHIVAYITDGSTKEVLQAAQVDVVE